MSNERIDPAFLRDQIVGVDSTFETPFGQRLMVYCDYTASGRCLRFVESYLQSLQRVYANTHTEDDITGRSMSQLLHEAEEAIKESVNAGPNGRIIACGTGATGAIDKLQQIIGVALAPVLFAEYVPRKLIWFSAIYPFLMPWLLWGGTLWTPILVIAGLVIGVIAFKAVSAASGALFGFIVGVLATVLWWLFLTAPLSGALHSLISVGVAPVESREFGGFMLSITIGIVAIAISLPLGIMLALGRRSDLLIVKALCVGFIEFIRGVPLITLLFVASTLLNIFMPPGTDFDIILRVIIMATLFASAYMAEVIRGGLAALPTGQYEGADSLGLDYWQSQRLIIMPQALKISIPGIVSTFIGLFKDTVLVSIIGLLDPLGLSNAIRADAAWNGIVWELYGFIALLFFIFCFGMSRYSMYLERKLQTGHS